MASMMKSEVSRLLIGTFRKVEARFSSPAISASGAKSGMSTLLPCGGTSFDIYPPVAGASLPGVHFLQADIRGKQRRLAGALPRAKSAAFPFHKRDS